MGYDDGAPLVQGVSHFDFLEWRDMASLFVVEFDSVASSRPIKAVSQPSVYAWYGTCVSLYVLGYVCVALCMCNASELLGNGPCPQKLISGRVLF